MTEGLIGRLKKHGRAGFAIGHEAASALVAERERNAALFDALVATLAAARQFGAESIVASAINAIARDCPRCSGTMLPSKALAQTFTGTPDFPGGEVVTMSPGGPGKLVDCLKCNVCGHSVAA